MGKLRYDLTGKRFGALTVVGRADNDRGYVSGNCVSCCNEHIQRILAHRGTSV